MNSTAKYHAECWAENKNSDEIKEEISHLEAMWTSKLPNPFPKSADFAYSRLETLKQILLTK